MNPNEFTIQIDLNHSKETVWNVITDFQSYPKWNSILNMKNNDELNIGESFNVIITEGKKKSRFKAKTLAVKPFQSFSAIQVMIAKWFFSATHDFILEEKSETLTTFRQTWVFTGILYKPFKKIIFNQLTSFNQMNKDLKIYLDSREVYYLK